MKGERGKVKGERGKVKGETGERVMPLKNVGGCGKGVEVSTEGFTRSRPEPSNTPYTLQAGWADNGR